MHASPSPGLLGPLVNSPTPLPCPLPRAPYLEAGPTYFQTLQDAGFEYDSSIRCALERGGGRDDTRATPAGRRIHAPPPHPAPPPPPPERSDYWGAGGAPTPYTRSWPYNLGGGFKTNCPWFGGLNCTGTYPKLWELPLQLFQVCA